MRRFESQSTMRYTNRTGNKVRRESCTGSANFGGEIKKALGENIAIMKEGIKPAKGAWQDIKERKLSAPNTRKAIKRTFRKGVRAAKRHPGKAFYKGAILGGSQFVPVPGAGIAAVGALSVAEGSAMKAAKIAKKVPSASKKLMSAAVRDTPVEMMFMRRR